MDAYEFALIKEYSINVTKKKHNVLFNTSSNSTTTIVSTIDPKTETSQTSALTVYSEDHISTLTVCTSLSAVVVVGSTSEQEEVIDSVDGRVDSIVIHEISLPYSVKRLPVIPVTSIAHNVISAIENSHSSTVDAEHEKTILLSIYVRALPLQDFRKVDITFVV